MQPASNSLTHKKRRIVSKEARKHSCQMFPLRPSFPSFFLSPILPEHIPSFRPSSFTRKKRKEEKKEGRREGKTEANYLLTLSVLIAAVDCGRPVGLHLPVAGIYCIQETSDAIYKTPLCCNVKGGVATQRGWGEGEEEKRGRRKKKTVVATVGKWWKKRPFHVNERTKRSSDGRKGERKE